HIAGPFQLAFVQFLRWDQSSILVIEVEQLRLETIGVRAWAAIHAVCRHGASADYHSRRNSHAVHPEIDYVRLWRAGSRRQAGTGLLGLRMRDQLRNCGKTRDVEKEASAIHGSIFYPEGCGRTKIRFVLFEPFLEFIELAPQLGKLLFQDRNATVIYS